MIEFVLVTLGEDERSCEDGGMRKMVERSSGGSLLMGTLEVLCARFNRTCEEGGCGLRRAGVDRFGLRVVVDDEDRRLSLECDLRARLRAGAGDSVTTLRAEIV